MTDDALRFAGEVFTWRGPAPHHFIAVPEPERSDLHELAPSVTYGWGMIRVRVRIGATEFTTSLWPKDGGYLLPLKVAVRRAEGIDVGDTIAVELVPERG